MPPPPLSRHAYARAKKKGLVRALPGKRGYTSVYGSSFLFFHSFSNPDRMHARTNDASYIRVAVAIGIALKAQKTGENRASTCGSLIF